MLYYFLSRTLLRGVSRPLRLHWGPSRDLAALGVALFINWHWRRVSVEIIGSADLQTATPKRTMVSASTSKRRCRA
jgi:hypothetical protein